jgi:hypothetical protein
MSDQPNPQIQELLERLKGTNDDKEKRKIRSRLRSLGHRGGLGEPRAYTPGQPRTPRYVAPPPEPLDVPVLMGTRASKMSDELLMKIMRHPDAPQGSSLFKKAQHEWNVRAKLRLKATGKAIKDAIDDTDTSSKAAVRGQKKPMEKHFGKGWHQDPGHAYLDGRAKRELKVADDNLNAIATPSPQAKKGRRAIGAGLIPGTYTKPIDMGRLCAKCGGIKIMIWSPDDKDHGSACVECEPHLLTKHWPHEEAEAARKKLEPKKLNLGFAPGWGWYVYKRATPPEQGFIRLKPSLDEGFYPSIKEAIKSVKM